MTDDLLALADAEIRRLQEELAAARAAERRAREAADALAAENAELHRRLAEQETPPSQPLAGLRIGVIGHPRREADYRAVVERLGGQLLFAPAQGTKLALVDRVVQKARGTVYLTSWGTHKAHQRAVRAAQRHGRPLVLSDQPGLASLERVIVQELLPQLEEEQG